MTDLEKQDDLVAEVEVRLETGHGPGGRQVYIADDERLMRCLLDRLEAAERERDDNLKNEIEVRGRLSALLDNCTGSRMSKSVYTLDAMIQEIEAHYQRREDEELAEAVARAEAAEAKIARIEALHKRSAEKVRLTFAGPAVHTCRICNWAWPCPTVRALQESEGE